MFDDAGLRRLSPPSYICVVAVGFQFVVGMFVVYKSINHLPRICVGKLGVFSVMSPGGLFLRSGGIAYANDYME